MNGTFALWDMVTANLIATYTSEGEALAFIRQVIEDGDRDLIDGWALGWENDRDEGGQIAAGGTLADRALSYLTA